MTQQHTNNSNSNSQSEKPALESSEAGNEAMFGPRFHFNSGFHDGTDDQMRNRQAPWHGSEHFCSDYARGYAFGQNVFMVTGKRPESSAEAWGLYSACLDIEAMPEIEDAAGKLWDLLDTAAASSAPLAYVSQVAMTVVRKHGEGALPGYEWAALTEKIARLSRVAN